MKVLGQTDFRFEFSASFYIGSTGQNWFWRFLWCFLFFVALSIIKTLKTHYNWAFQALGVWKNDVSWSKPPWSIYQSLFWLENDHDNCPHANPGRKFDFFKIALNRVLTLPNARSRKMRQIPLKIMGLQNKNISVVTQHWKYRISVPMSYISVPMSQNMDLCGIRGQQEGLPKSIPESPPH